MRRADRSDPGIHALHGFVGSGKTTFARRLERELPGMRFTPDEWLVALYGPDLNAGEFPPAFDRVMSLMERQWTRALDLGVPVILDHGYWRRADRESLRVKAAALGVPGTLYALTLPDEEALRRVKLRNTRPGALPITGETFRLLRARFEPLGPDEEAVQVEPG